LDLGEGLELCPPEGEYGLSLSVFGNSSMGSLTGFPFGWRATKAWTEAPLRAGWRHLAWAASAWYFTSFTLKKIECSKQFVRTLNNSAWDNRI
jgi:hypothetical protein